MEQETDIKKQLTAFIAAPEKISREDIPVLRELASLYPYFQPIHLLSAKAQQEEKSSNALAHAALYADGQLLHNFLHAPEALIRNTFQVFSAASFGSDLSQPETLDEVAIDEVEEEVPKAIAPEQEKLEDELVLENIVSTDFFAFQDNFKVEPVPAEELEVPEQQTEPELIEAEENIISKYDDDKLPYTFLWWLAKTRKEHQQIFQPYASPKKQLAAAGETKALRQNELQQQYVEHIFHLQSAFTEEDKSYAPTQFKRNSKGDEIIESFIKNEPQISPPNPEQINNENKAKKSAEDHNDLVSETLAKIYIEQMLYDKAIETYEKLSLKFPEKSRYFADLVQSIEKKI